jgi:hypothetical protein
MERHGYDGLATFWRNNARSPIDGIWATPENMIAQGGFQYDLIFMNTDHQCLWIDISYEQAIGHNMPPLFPPQAKKLHCRGPRLVQNYVSIQVLKQ